MEPAARAQRLASGDGYPWEGPRPKFTLLMGESPTWDGPGAWFELREVEARGGPFVRKFYGDERGHGACRICGALGELPPYAVCLHCCRTGRDGEIGVGAPRTEPKRHRPGKLKGGMS